MLIGGGERILHLSAEFEHLLWAHVGIERPVFGQVAEAARELEALRRIAWIQAQQPHRPGGRREEAGQDLHRGRFPRPVWAEEGCDRALVHLEAQLVQRGELAVVLRDPVGTNGRLVLGRFFTHGS